MQITRSFDLAQPAELVWRALSDVRLVASCLPGASVTEELGEDRYKGSFQVKLGPLAAAFAGEVTIERREAERSATVTGKGTDSRSASRATGTMTYRLVPQGERATRVEVESTLNLAGALAQFGKGAVIQEVAGRITATFAANLDAKLAAAQQAAETTQAAPPEAAPAPQPAPPQQAAPMDAGGLLWAVIRDRIAAWLRRIFGRPAQL